MGMGVAIGQFVRCLTLLTARTASKHGYMLANAARLLTRTIIPGRKRQTISRRMLGPGTRYNRMPEQLHAPFCKYSFENFGTESHRIKTHQISHCYKEKDSRRREVLLSFTS
jgi:hypothetical protein